MYELDQSTLPKVRKACRITGTTLDSEIADLCLSAMYDMNDSGVEVVDDTDQRVLTAIIEYVKSKIGLDESKREDHFASYRLIVTKLAILERYKTPVNGENNGME